LTLIPIRIDLDIPAHQQEAPFPLPPRTHDQVINTALPQYKRPDPSPAYKLRDIFLWNLHESLLTPDDFAQVLVRELDLPNQTALTVAISQQIRTQLEEYAGVALHPLFHNQPKLPLQTPGATTALINGAATPRALTNGHSRDGTPATPKPLLALQGSRHGSHTPNASTPTPSTPAPTQPPNGALVTAEAILIPDSIPQPETTDPYLNPDDTYRCIITLSISLSSRLYSDKFEWSLLHPPGAAEAFAKQTCADMSLGGEWVLAITHAIYEAVLRLKKEACEGGMYGLELDNQCVRYEEGAGWRYDADDFGAEWEPRFEKLAKEEIEKREGDRERQLRRLRRETARFSSTAGMVPSARENEARERADYFGGGYGSGGGGGAGDETPVMGRGERSKKKRRFRSLSPVAKALNAQEVMGGGSNGAGTGWGGAANQLSEYERQNWRCRWCSVWGSAVWAVRDGPGGVRTLCNNCGLLFERDRRLPVWSEGLHRGDVPAGAVR
jgi:chromatin structure-remodeling complex subunit SFH1